MVGQAHDRCSHSNREEWEGQKGSWLLRKAKTQQGKSHLVARFKNEPLTCGSVILVCPLAATKLTHGKDTAGHSLFLAHCTFTPPCRALVVLWRQQEALRSPKAWGSPYSHEALAEPLHLSKEAVFGSLLPEAQEVGRTSGTCAAFREAFAILAGTHLLTCSLGRRGTA